MEHSNKIEREMEYAWQNEEYLDEKRARLREFKVREEKDEPRKNNFYRKYCCLLVAAVILASVYLIYYFVVNIKDSVVKDYNDKKQAIEQALPEVGKEIDKSAEQGKDLLNQTENNVNKARSAYENAKALIETGKNAYNKLQDIKNGISQ